MQSLNFWPNINDPAVQGDDFLASPRRCGMSCSRPKQVRIVGLWVEQRVDLTPDGMHVRLRAEGRRSSDFGHGRRERRENKAQAFGIELGAGMTPPVASRRPGNAVTARRSLPPDGGDAWAPAKPCWRTSSGLFSRLARAHRWRRMLEQCRAIGWELADAAGVTRSFVNRLLTANASAGHC